jgi:YHS domain-containing protein
MNKKARLIALLAVMAVTMIGAVVAQQKSDEKAIDPVCGMTVVKASAAATYDYKGTKYYFCSTGCKEAFAKDPEKFLPKAASAAEKKDVRGPMMGRMMGMPHGGPMRMMAGPMGAGVNRILFRRDVDWTYEKTADGVIVKVTSKDPETVRTIQERLAMAKEMKETMMAPPAAGSDACPCANCPMRNRVKK